AHQAVHDGLVERVAHVQRAGYIGRGELDDVGLVICPCFYVLACREITAALPFGVPLSLERCGLKALGQVGGIGVRRDRGSGFGHYWVPAKDEGPADWWPSKPFILRCIAVLAAC